MLLLRLSREEFSRSTTQTTCTHVHACVHERRDRVLLEPIRVDENEPVRTDPLEPHQES